MFFFFNHPGSWANKQSYNFTFSKTAIQPLICSAVIIWKVMSTISTSKFRIIVWWWWLNYIEEGKCWFLKIIWVSIKNWNLWIAIWFKIRSEKEQRNINFQEFQRSKFGFEDWNFNRKGSRSFNHPGTSKESTFFPTIIKITIKSNNLFCCYKLLRRESQQSHTNFCIVKKLFSGKITENDQKSVLIFDKICKYDCGNL